MVNSEGPPPPPGSRKNIKTRPFGDVGCVPKKIMWNAAEIAKALHDASSYGFEVPKFSHDWAKLQHVRDSYLSTLFGIYQQKLQEAGITVVEGDATDVHASATEKVSLDD